MNEATMWADRVAAVAEAAQERVWRERCGEPNRDRYPVRCRRDLRHATPHIGLVSPAEPVAWPGVGNDEPVQVTGKHCWCSPRSGAR